MVQLTRLLSGALFVVLVFFTGTVTAQASSRFVQLGGDIVGSATGDQIGRGLAISGDGSTIAVGSYLGGNGDGYVRVYRLENNALTQIGNDINGSGAEWLGFSVALSEDGTILAIGAPSYDGAGTSRGRALVYQYSSGDWNPLGIAIEGGNNSDSLGKTVDLSADGLTLALASPGENSSAGAVRVYDFVSGSWSLRHSHVFNGSSAGDQVQSGEIALSADGSIVAIGAPNNDDSASNAGHVRVYQDSGSAWSQLGGDLRGVAVNDQFGYSVGLSADGLTLAVGAVQDFSRDGYVQVFRYSGSWAPLGSTLEGDGTAAAYFGRAVSLDSAGDTLSVAAPYLFGETPGRAYTYDFVGTSWELVSELTGRANGEQFGTNLALDNLGVRLVVSAYDANGAAGRVELYGPPTPQVSSPNHSEELGPPGIFLTFPNAQGQRVSSEAIVYGSDRLSPRTPYRFTITPRDPSIGAGPIAVQRGVFLSGSQVGEFQFPALSPGNYRLELVATDPVRGTLRLVNYFVVGEGETLVTVSDERLQPFLG